VYNYIYKKEGKNMSNIPQTIKENEVLLILKNVETEETLHTIIDNNEEVILWSIGSDIQNDEVIAYAFESNVEIGRISREDEELLADQVSYEYEGFIIRNESDLKEWREYYL